MFINSAILEHERTTNNWKVYGEKLIYESKRFNRFVVVPAGFPTDLASVPSCLKWAISRSDKIILEASIIHDFLYSTPNGRMYQADWTREQVDLVLRDAMQDLGASCLKSNLVYWVWFWALLD
jgi:hypothetical protein